MAKNGSDIRMDIRVAEKRVERPELEEIFRSGAFFNLPAYKSEVLASPFSRANGGAVGLEIPVGSLGRKKQVTESTAESLLLWVKLHLSEVVRAKEVAFRVDNGRIMLYRREPWAATEQRESR